MMSGFVATCVAGDCRYSCAAGRANCDGVSGNGCESEPQTDVNNCGACGNRCTMLSNFVTSCTAGACGLSCPAGFGNCDGVSGNGCETNVNAATAHCGRCNNRCATGQRCMSGACIM